MGMDQELAVLAAALHQAGKAVRQVMAAGLQTTYKRGDDPLTQADVAANRVLQECLLGAFPEDGWLSEETWDDQRRLTRMRVWVVDPIDGTRELVQGIPEYALSVAFSGGGGTPVGRCVQPGDGGIVFGGGRSRGHGQWAAGAGGSPLGG
jgi:Archaeal fructose-1,6-bisphosphatase and related enzymes of inositol monophosphatase family